MTRPHFFATIDGVPYLQQRNVARRFKFRTASKSAAVGGHRFHVGVQRHLVGFVERRLHRRRVLIEGVVLVSRDDAPPVDGSARAASDYGSGRYLAENGAARRAANVAPRSSTVGDILRTRRDGIWLEGPVDVHSRRIPGEGYPRLSKSVNQRSLRASRALPA